jgi:hypothetical protein
MPTASAEADRRLDRLVEESTRDLRAFARAWTGLDLGDAQVRSAERGDQTNVRLAGRRFGKTVATLVRALWHLVTTPRSTWYVTAPSLDQARLYFGELGEAAARSSLLEAFMDGPQKDSPFPEVRFRNAGRSVSH